MRVPHPLARTDPSGSWSPLSSLCPSSSQGVSVPLGSAHVTASLRTLLQLGTLGFQTPLLSCSGAVQNTCPPNWTVPPQQGQQEHTGAEACRLWAFLVRGGTGHHRPWLCRAPRAEAQRTTGSVPTEASQGLTRTRHLTGILPVALQKPTQRQGHHPPLHTGKPRLRGTPEVPGAGLPSGGAMWSRGPCEEQKSLGPRVVEVGS